MKQIPEIQAVFWDFDGVILDSEPLHFQAFKETLNPAGIDFSWQEYQADYMGFDDRDALDFAFNSHNMPLNQSLQDNYINLKAEVFQRMLSERNLQPYPGVLELLHGWKEAGIPQTICSGALLRDILPVLQRLHLNDCFESVITADQVKASKPHSETYELGLQTVLQTKPDLDPASCIAIEDTPAGIQSAQGAGLFTVAVAHTHPAEKLSDADLCIESLHELIRS